MGHDQSRLAEEGFLADEVAAVVAMIRGRYAAHFKHLGTLNRLLTGAQYSLRAHPESAQELTSSVLFVRSLSHCQAVLILAERGMLAPAKAAARCALEGLFNLGACASDPSVALKFVDADRVDRRRRAKYLGQVNDPQARAQLDQEGLDEILKNVQATIDEVEAKELKTRTMAQVAGLEDLYLTAYAMLSGAVHSSVGDLDHHFRIDSNGRVELLTEPTAEGLEGLLLIVGETMVGLVRAVSKVFDLGIVEACDSWLVEFQKLYQGTGVTERSEGKERIVKSSETGVEVKSKACNQLSPVEVFDLWKKYEDVAMHFNDLIMRWRLQAIGGLAGLVTLAGFVVGDAATLLTRYRAMLILSGVLAVAWLGVAFIDLAYYRRLLKGAVNALISLESKTPEISLSTTIDHEAKWGGDWAPYIFYACGLLPLLGIICWALYQLSVLPLDVVSGR